MPTQGLVRNELQSAILKCLTGAITVSVGDTFHRVEPSEDWTVVGFGNTDSLVVMCKPRGRMPGWARQYAEADGAVAFCDDTVAAYLLEKQDGKPRSARGDYLLKSTK